MEETRTTPDEKVLHRRHRKLLLNNAFQSGFLAGASRRPTRGRFGWHSAWGLLILAY
jgi:hypothetical protein